MKPSEIQAGRFYVNESKGLVREIMDVRDDAYVEYLSYWLSDGVCDGLLGVCQDRTLANWADREAFKDEITQLKISEARDRRPKSERALLERLSRSAGDASDDPFAEYFPDGFTIRDEANALVAWAFRNGPLEDLHAGAHSALLEDLTQSRMTDEEMKELMLYACRQLATLLELKATDPSEYERQIKSYNWRYCRRWER